MSKRPILTRDKAIDMFTKLLDEALDDGTTDELDFFAVGLSGEGSDNIISGASGSVGAIIHFGVSALVNAIEADADEVIPPKDLVEMCIRSVIHFLEARDDSFVTDLKDSIAADGGHGVIAVDVAKTTHDLGDMDDLFANISDTKS